MELSSIYKIDDVLLLENLISYGCIKILTTFSCTHKHFYKIFVINRNKYYKRILNIRHISPRYFEKYYTFNNKSFEFKIGDYNIWTNTYSLVCNSDICGCVNKKSIIHIKFPIGSMKFYPNIKCDEQSRGRFHKIMGSERACITHADEYYTLYPSNSELVISKRENIQEKRLLDTNIIDENYFNNIQYKETRDYSSYDKKYLNKSKCL